MAQRTDGDDLDQVGDCRLMPVEDEIRLNELMCSVDVRSYMDCLGQPSACVGQSLPCPWMDGRFRRAAAASESQKSTSRSETRGMLVFLNAGRLRNGPVPCSANSRSQHRNMGGSNSRNALLETHMLETPTSRWTFGPPFTISSRHCLLEINLSRNH